MKWSTEKRKVSELVDNEINPRTISAKQKKDLSESLDKFGLAEIPAVNLDNVIIAGHQRIGLLRASDPKAEIEVRVPDRLLTAEEVKEYMIRSNKNTGHFDYEMLQEKFDADELVNWGFSKNELPFIENEAEVTKKVCVTPELEYILISFDKADDYFNFIEKVGINEGAKLNYKQWK
jgi:hypothetical protein